MRGKIERSEVRRGGVKIHTLIGGVAACAAVACDWVAECTVVYLTNEPEGFMQPTQFVILLPGDKPRRIVREKLRMKFVGMNGKDLPVNFDAAYDIEL